MKTIRDIDLKQFVINPEEALIFVVLLKINADLGLNTTFRVAGGWVRDKLLGNKSDDLDIAMDNMTGRQFADHFVNFAKTNPDSGLGKIYHVEETPGVKLETAAVVIHGRKIDFINLRTESYGDTRVPEMKFGTAEADARRRDLTINALFYNINTGMIEDFVDGLEDLKNMHLRTPLNPLQTFKDDPLRTLRVLRFFSRFENASVDPAIVHAIADPEVHAAYREKVASERAGAEIIKLLEGARPGRALRFMFASGLDKAVFDIPAVRELNDLHMDQRNSHHAHTLIDHTLLVVDNMHEIVRKENPRMQVKMLLAALLHDFGKAHPDIAKPKKSDPNQMTYVGHEEKSAEIAEEVMKSISIPDEDRKFVNKVISLHMRPHKHMGESWTPKTMGKFLRECQIPGQEAAEVWRWVMLHAIADTLAKDAKNPDVADAMLKRLDMQAMQDFKEKPGPSVMKPVLNGNDLMQMFPGLKPTTIVDGKNFIKEISERLLDDQATGAIIDREQAKTVIETMRSVIEEKFSQKS